MQFRGTRSGIFFCAFFSAGEATSLQLAAWSVNYFTIFNNSMWWCQWITIECFVTNDKSKKIFSQKIMAITTKIEIEKTKVDGVLLAARSIKKCYFFVAFSFYSFYCYSSRLILTMRDHRFIWYFHIFFNQFSFWLTNILGAHKYWPKYLNFKHPLQLSISTFNKNCELHGSQKLTNAKCEQWIKLFINLLLVFHYFLLHSIHSPNWS